MTLHKILEMCKRGHPRTPENTYTKPDGYKTCNVCSAESKRNFNERNPGYHKGRDRKQDRTKWFAKGNNKEKYEQWKKDYVLRNPVKMKARRLLQRAVFNKKIHKPTTCEMCNKPNKIIHAHHYDYLRAYDVLWVCHKCHEWLHHTKIGELRWV
jgi:hypothetical protein